MRVHFAYPVFSEFNPWEKDFVPALKQQLLNGQAQGYVQEENPDKADIVVLIESNIYKSRHHIGNMLREPYVKQYPNKIYTINYEDDPAGFLPGVYAAMSKLKFYPEFHRSGTYLFRPLNEEMIESQVKRCRDVPKLLFSFRGACSHPLRSRLFKAYEGKKDREFNVFNIRRWYDHTEEEKINYITEMLDSKFVLCPRGITSGPGHRLYEVMQLGRCPVVIDIQADDWVRPRRVEWDRFLIQISEKEIPRLRDILRSREKNWRNLGAAARETWERYFCKENRLKYDLDEISDIAMKRIKAIENGELQRYWESAEFHRINGWLMGQRILRRARSLSARFVVCFKERLTVVRRFFSLIGN